MIEGLLTFVALLLIGLIIIGVKTMAVLDDIKADIVEIQSDLAAIVAKIDPNGISAADAAQLKSDLDGVVSSMDTAAGKIPASTTGAAASKPNPGP